MHKSIRNSTFLAMTFLLFSCEKKEDKIKTEQNKNPLPETVDRFFLNPKFQDFFSSYRESTFFRKTNRDFSYNFNDFVNTIKTPYCNEKSLKDKWVALLIYTDNLVSRIFEDHKDNIKNYKSNLQETKENLNKLVDNKLNFLLGEDATSDLFCISKHIFLELCAPWNHSIIKSESHQEEFKIRKIFNSSCIYTNVLYRLLSNSYLGS